MPEPQRRRRRPAVSCTLCRQRKIRCDRNTPCSNCIRSRNHACEYENLPVLPHRPRESDSEKTPSATSSVAAPTPDVESMRHRIVHLENQLENALKGSLQSTTSTPSTAATPVSSIETAESRIGGTFYIHHGNPALGQSPDIHRNITHKKRMYGQSHWMNLSLVLVKDIARMIDGQAKDPNTKDFCEKVLTDMQKCKRVARAIKAQREPPWPCPATSELPPKQICDGLVDCYLRTHETVYRILHVPSFKRNYDSLWTTTTEPDSVFMIQLKLVMASGAATYDDTFTLRSSAMRWVHEAETWIAHPHLKHRLNIQYVQIYCLQLLAREATAVGEDMVFISTGTLLRSSMFLGLHRDPAHLPSRTVFANEMHRRLWSTVLEICLQTSLYSGCPPLISMDDFDTQPAGNLDDDQLENEDAVSRPDTCFTQSSVSIALRKTFSYRLAVVKFLNNFASSGTYNETLRIDSELRTAYKTLRSTFRAFDPTCGSSPSGFQLRLVDTTFNRYLCALHAPFFTSALKDTKYAYSRKAVFDTSIKIWYAVYPTLDNTSMPSSDDRTSLVLDDFQRLVICGHGFFRSATMQAVLMIAIETRSQLQEDDSLGPNPLQREFFSILEGAKTWSLRCMEAGETNVKGHVFTSLMLAYSQGLAKGLHEKEIGKLLVEAAAAAEENSMAMLEQMLERDTPKQSNEGVADLSLDPTQDILAGWESIHVPEGMADPFGFDNMNWTFDQDSMQSAWLF